MTKQYLDPPYERIPTEAYHHPNICASSTESIEQFQTFYNTNAVTVVVRMLLIFLVVMHDLSKTSTQLKVQENRECCI